MSSWGLAGLASAYLLGPESWIPTLLYVSTHARQTVDTAVWVGSWVLWGGRWVAVGVGGAPAPEEEWQWVEGDPDRGGTDVFDLLEAEEGVEALRNSPSAPPLP